MTYYSTVQLFILIVRSLKYYTRASNPTDSSVIYGNDLPITDYGNRLNFTGVGKIFLIWQILALVRVLVVLQPRRSAGGKFKVSWKLPVGITASSMGAECPLQVVHKRFSIAHVITQHIKAVASRFWVVRPWLASFPGPSFSFNRDGEKLVKNQFFTVPIKTIPKIWDLGTRLAMARGRRHGMHVSEFSAVPADKEYFSCYSLD